MTTLWKYRVFIFVRAKDATNANKNELASIYVNNGSGETLANEKLMFNSVVRFSSSGQEPATVYGLNLTAQTNMKDEFIALISALTNPAWVILANTAFNGHADGEVVALSANLPQGAVGMVVTWEQAKGYLFSQFGLREIVPPEPLGEGASVSFGATPTASVRGRIVPAYTTALGERVWNALPERVREWATKA